MHKKILLITAFLCLSPGVVFAQDEIPVNLYSGTPSIEIPLWTLVDHDISVPISLSYSASGVKLQQDDGWYGLGWDLVAAGSIVRETRGLPDDFADSRKGWLYANASGTGVANAIGAFGNNADLSASTCSDETADYNSIRDFDNLIDTEPDIFRFNFGGFSGAFAFDNSPIPVIRFMPHKDFYITYTTKSETDKSITGFMITTASGFTYIFSQAVSAIYNANRMGAGPVTYLERHYNQYGGIRVTYTSEWKLTRIQSPSGAYVNFAYDLLDSPVSASDPVVIALYDTEADYYSTTVQYSTTDWRERYWLSTITGSAGQQVRFAKPSNETLDLVTILDGRGGLGTEVKRFSLDYQSIWSRKFLKKVSEWGGCDRIPPYLFEYIGTNNPDNGLPPVTSSSKDFWGYYNGRKPSDPTVDKGIPKMFIYPNEPLADRFRLCPIPAYTGKEIILDGVDRQPNEAFMKIGTLNKVTYPTGGSLVIQYAANTYYDPRTRMEYPGGGLRIKSISQFDGMNNPSRITKTFDYTDPVTGKSSGKLINRPVFIMPVWMYKSTTGTAVELTYANALATKSEEQLWKLMTIRTDQDLSDREETQESSVGYQFVTVKRPGIGFARFEFSAPGTYNTQSVDFWSPTINKFARPASCPGMGIVADAGLWGYPFSRNSLADFERGLVLKKMEFDEEGNKVRYTENVYQNLFASGTQPVFISGLQYEQYANASEPIFFYGKYTLPMAYDKVLQKQLITVYDKSNVSKNITEATEYLYNSPVHRYLSQMKKTDSDGTVHTSSFVYPDDYGAIPADAENALLRVRELQNPALGRRSTLLETIQAVQPPGSDSQVIGASLTLYSNFGKVGKILPERKLSFRCAVPVTNFVRSGIESASPAVLRKDARYEDLQTCIKVDANDNPVTMVGIDKTPSTMAWGYAGTAVVASVSNAMDGEFAFSDFDASTSVAFDVSGEIQDFSGRSESKCAMGKSFLSKQLTKANVQNYKLSFWIKTNEQLSFRVALKDQGRLTVYYENLFQVESSTSGEFQHIQKIIPMEGVPSSFFIELESMTQQQINPNILLDDVAFHAENAQMVYYGYRFPYGTTTITASHGNTAYVEYDNLGRVLYTYDQDKNIVSRNTYNFSRSFYALSSDFSVPANVYRDFPAVFTAIGTDNGCIDGVSYSWDMGDGFIGGSNLNTYTFTRAGTQTIRLRVSHPDYGEFITTKTVTVLVKPISVQFCVAGTDAYECSRSVSKTSSNCDSATPFTGTLFRVTAEDAPGIRYNWKRRQEGSTQWTSISGQTGSDYLLSGVGSAERSFYIMCEVETPDGRKGSTESFLVIVYLCEHKGGKP